MSYKDEWLMIEANDDIDEDFHREPTEEFLFYRAVANGDVETVRRNCEQARFEDQEGVGVLSRNPVTNMKYHFVVTTAMITRMCRQYGMELEQAFRLSDFYIRQLDDMPNGAICLSCPSLLHSLSSRSFRCWIPSATAFLSITAPASRRSGPILWAWPTTKACWIPTCSSTRATR